MYPTCTPQSCVSSPLLVTLLTHDRSARWDSNHIIKFADNTAVVGLIGNEKEEDADRREVEQRVVWLKEHNRALNTSKTKEMIVDFSETTSNHHQPLTIDGSVGERAQSAKFLGVLLTEDVATRSNTTSIIQKQLRRVKRANLHISMDFYHQRCICRACSIISDPSHSLFFPHAVWEEVQEHLNRNHPAVRLWNFQHIGPHKQDVTQHVLFIYPYDSTASV